MWSSAPNLQGRTVCTSEVDQRVGEVRSYRNRYFTLEKIMGRKTRQCSSFTFRIDYLCHNIQYFVKHLNGTKHIIVFNRLTHGFTGGSLRDYRTKGLVMSE